MEIKGYPDSFYRGIPNKDFVVDGIVVQDAFQFDKEIRDDGFKELSINWNDDDNALKILLEKRKDNGKIHYAGGVAFLELIKVKRYLSQLLINKDFYYERREVPGNIYHGNLLMNGSLDKRLRALIMNGLALTVDSIILPNDD